MANTMAHRVMDTNDIISLSSIGIVPVAIALLAQAVPDLPGGPVDWSNLTAGAVILGLFLWLLTKHIPARELRNEQRQDERDRKHEERLDRIQSHFSQALTAQLQASKESAQSGHAALQAVVEKQHVMATSVDKNTESIRELCRRLDTLPRNHPLE